VASPAYEQILEVQRVDQALTQARHRHASHPLRADVEAKADQVAKVEAQFADLDGRRHELDRGLKRLSDEVALIETKRAGVDTKLYGGSVTASKDLLALQDEAAQLLGRQRGLEDEELEIMEQQEELESELASVRADLAVASDAKAQAEGELTAALAGLDAEISDLTAERVQAVEPVAADLLARYEEMAPAFEGVAVARLVNGRCDGCHIQLSAVAVDQLGRAPDDAVVACEECGRLLVR
jgi:predicted  nucleic acid-binding Zn-ribbon protein